MTFAERHDKAVLYVTAAIIALLPLIGTFAHRGYGAAMLLVGIVIATKPDVWRAGVARFIRVRNFRDPATLAAWSFAAFSAWLLLSGLWSEIKAPWRVWSDFSFTVLAVGALVYESARRATRDPPGFKLIAAAFVASVAASALLLAFEAATGAALRKALPPDDPSGSNVKDWIALARGLSAVTPSLFAAAAVFVLLRRRLDGIARLAIGALFALAAFAASAFSVAANTLALFGGALAYGAAIYAPKSTLRALGAAIVLTTALAPLAASIPAKELAAAAPLDLSWKQRIFIYEKAGDAVIACAPFGCGADYARALSRSEQTVEIPGTNERLPVMPLHPHNVFLQVWMDLGAPGAFVFAAAIWFGCAALARLEAPRLFFGAAAAVITAVLVSALTEMSLWQNWRIAAAGFAAGGLALSYGFHHLHLNSGGEQPSGR